MVRREAGDGNRTHTTCLEGRDSTIELHPRCLSGFRLSWAASASSVPAVPRLFERRSRLFPVRDEKWVEQDSNLRRQSHQIYSLAPLAAWVSTLVGSAATVFPVPILRVGRSAAFRAVSASRRARAGGESRTHNLRFTKPLLCQLSYASSLLGRESTTIATVRRTSRKIPKIRRPVAYGRGVMGGMLTISPPVGQEGGGFGSEFSPTGVSFRGAEPRVFPIFRAFWGRRSGAPPR